MTWWAEYEWDERRMRDLELAYEEYMDSLHEYMMGEMSAEDLDAESTESFCGCEICWRRETFAFLMPRFIELYKTNYIWDAKQHTNKEADGGLQLVSDGGGMESGGVRE